jgi:HSP20 family protein
MMDASLYRETLSERWHEGIAPIDLYETDDEVVLKAALPGVSAEDIDISISNGMVSVRAEVSEEREEKDEKGVRYHLRERRYKRLSRSMRLPSAVDASKADAEFENGVLRLRMPKVEEAKPKTITIKAK